MTEEYGVRLHTRLDHFMIGGPSLEQLAGHFALLCGVEPTTGGRHPDLGTHNALSGLDGAGAYLEFIAPDPQSASNSPLREELAALSLPTLCRVIVSCDAGAMDAASALYERQGWEAPVRAFSRQTPDGSELRWRLLIPRCPPADALFAPYLIDWGDTPHPTTRLAAAGLRLLDVEAGHPDAPWLRALWEGLGIDWPVARCARAYLRVRLETPCGVVSLNSA